MSLRRMFRQWWNFPKPKLSENPFSVEIKKTEPAHIAFRTTGSDGKQIVAVIKHGEVLGRQPDLQEQLKSDTGEPIRVWSQSSTGGLPTNLIQPTGSSD